MNAWETIIQQIRNGDISGATLSYKFATKLPIEEARAVIVKAAEKIRGKPVQRKAAADENVSDQTNE